MAVECCRVLALTLLVGFILATVVSIFAPYWIVFRRPIGNRGLVMSCSFDECVWMRELEKVTEKEKDKTFVEKLIPLDEDTLHSFAGNLMPDRFSYPKWYMATQGLMSVGLALGLIALLIATLSLCCTCHKCNPHPPISGLLAIAGLAMGVGCIVFGVKANQSWHIELEWESLATGRFGWSFWVAVAASVLSLLTSGIYGCIGRSS